MSNEENLKENIKPNPTPSPEERIYSSSNKRAEDALLKKEPKPNSLKGRGGKFFPKPLAGVFILLAVSGSALAGLYFTGSLEKILHLKETPEEVLAQMNEEMSKVKTFNFQTETSGKYSFSSDKNVSSMQESPMALLSSGEMNYKFNGDGGVDQTDSKNLKVSINFNGSIGVEGIDVSFWGKGRFLNETAYFKINKMPYGSMIEKMAPFKIKDQWFKFALKDLTKENGIPKEKFDKLMDLILKSNSWEKSSIIIEEELPIEQINNVKAYHYKGRLNKKAIKDQLLTFSEILGTELSEEDIIKSGKELDKMLENFDGNVELWIGKKDKRLYKMTLRHNFEFNNPEDASQMKVKTEGITTNIYSKFNEPVLIEAPKDAQDLGEWMKWTAPIKTNDSKRIADLNALSFGLEMYYLKNNSYPVSRTLIRTNEKESVLYKSLEEYGYIPPDGMPVDPKDPEFFYGYKSDGQNYELTAVLEDQTNPECVMEGELCIFRIKNGKVISKK